MTEQTVSFLQLAAERRQTVLTGSPVIPDILVITYECVPGNAPQTFKNTLFVWQDTEIPYSSPKPPLVTQSIERDQTQGTTFIQNELIDLSAFSYIAGYATGDRKEMISSTLVFLPGSSQPTAFATSIAVARLTTTFVTAAYATPTGNVPVEGSQWIGLWEGDTFRWDGKYMQTKQPVEGISATGTVTIPFNFTKPDTPYTLAYATGPDPTNIAAAVTFRTMPASALLAAPTRRLVVVGQPRA